MNGQVDMFEYMESRANEQVNYIPSLAIGLKNYCSEWGYDWLERLQENKTTDSFIKLFCRITRYFFFKYNDETYGAEILKNERKIKIYKCGRECGRILQEASIDHLVSRL